MAWLLPCLAFSDCVGFSCSFGAFRLCSWLSARVFGFVLGSFSARVLSARVFAFLFFGFARGLCRLVSLFSWLLARVGSCLVVLCLQTLPKVRLVSYRVGSVFPINPYFFPIFSNGLFKMLVLSIQRFKSFAIL